MPPLPPELLDAAERAFLRHGFAGATSERIAAEAGLSRVTLHRRGIGRTELLAALVERATDDYRREVWPALTAAGSAADRLRAALEALCTSSERHLALLLALRSQSDRIFHADEEGGEPGTLTRTVFTEPLERLLRDGQVDGTLRSSDPEQEATVLFNLVGWTYVHLRTEHGWEPERAARATLDPVLHGVLAHPGN